MFLVTNTSLSSKDFSDGTMYSFHMLISSAGGPGKATITFLSFFTSQPGAVPREFGTATADGIKDACFMLVKGICCPRFLNKSFKVRNCFSSTVILSPQYPAMASLVRSSDVGPIPPVVMMISEACSS